MKHTSSYIAALIITATVFVNATTVAAQEWRVFLGQDIFQTDQLSQIADKNTLEQKDWLATQTPLMKNTPLTGMDRNSRSLNSVTLDSNYSQVGSWAPLKTERGDEGFTLFKF